MHHDWEVDAPLRQGLVRADDACLDFENVLLRLEEEDVRPAVDEAQHLLAEIAGDLVKARFAEVGRGLRYHTVRRADGTDDEERPSVVIGVASMAFARLDRDFA